MHSYALLSQPVKLLNYFLFRPCSWTLAFKLSLESVASIVCSEYVQNSMSVSTVHDSRYHGHDLSHNYENSL